MKCFQNLSKQNTQGVKGDFCSLGAEEKKRLPDKLVCTQQSQLLRGQGSSAERGNQSIRRNEFLGI